MPEQKENTAKFIPEIELDVTKLPSRGLSYPTGAKVKYRTYMFGEIRKASTSTVGIEASLKLAMKGITASFGVKNLTIMDGLYIGILRKISSLNGLQFEVPYVCATCGKTDKGKFTQNDIKFNDIPDEVTELPICCEIDGKELQFKPMTVGDYLTMKAGTYDSIFRDEKLDKVAAHAICIKNMNFKEAYDLLYDLADTEDMEVITEIDKLLAHDIKPLDAICKNEIDGKVCGGKNSLKLEGREALISPFRNAEGATGTRIRFGVTSESEPTSD